MQQQILFSSVSSMAQLGASVVSAIATGILTTVSGWSLHSSITQNSGYPYVSWWYGYESAGASTPCVTQLVHSHGGGLIFGWTIRNDSLLTPSPIMPAPLSSESDIARALSSETNATRQDMAPLTTLFCAVIPSGRVFGDLGANTPADSVNDGFPYTGMVARYLTEVAWACLPQIDRSVAYGAGGGVGFQMPGGSEQTRTLRWVLPSVSTLLGTSSPEYASVETSYDAKTGSIVVTVGYSMINGGAPLYVWAFGPRLDTTESPSDAEGLYDHNWGRWFNVFCSPSATPTMLHTNGISVANQQAGSGENRQKLQHKDSGTYFHAQCCQPVGQGVWAPTVLRARGDSITGTGEPYVLPQFNARSLARGVNPPGQLSVGSLVQLWGGNWDAPLDSRCLGNPYIGTIPASTLCVANVAAAGPVGTIHQNGQSLLKHVGGGILVTA